MILLRIVTDFCTWHSWASERSIYTGMVFGTGSFRSNNLSPANLNHNQYTFPTYSSRVFRMSISGRDNDDNKHDQGYNGAYVPDELDRIILHSA